MKHLALRKGHWAKGKWNLHHLYDWALHAPENQISFLREACRLSLGHKPSAHFPLELEGTPRADAGTARYILEHSSHSRSHFTDKLGENKHAAGFADAIGDFVSHVASYAPKWSIKSAKYISKNIPTLSKYAYALSNVSGVLAPIGTAAGWWGEDRGQQIADITEAVKGVAGNYIKKPKAKKKAGSLSRWFNMDGGKHKRFMAAHADKMAQIQERTRNHIGNSKARISALRASQDFHGPSYDANLRFAQKKAGLI